MGWDGTFMIKRKVAPARWEDAGEIGILDLVVNRRSLAVALGSPDMCDIDVERAPYEFSFLISNGSQDWDSQSGYLDWNRFRAFEDTESDFPFRDSSEVIERVRSKDSSLAALLADSSEILRCEIDIAW